MSEGHGPYAHPAEPGTATGGVAPLPAAHAGASPAGGDRHFCTTTARGWTANRIYEYLEDTATWEEIILTAGAEVYVAADSMLYLWNGTTLQTITEGTQVLAHFTGVDLKAIANYTAAINGLSTDRFVPTNLIFRLTAAAGAVMNGDATISIGSTVAGTQILPATPLVGLTLINTTFSIPITGAIAVAIASNATLHARVTFADTSGGTATTEIFVLGAVL